MGIKAFWEKLFAEPEIFQQYRERESAKRLWTQRYSQGEMPIVEKVLHLFCTSFGFWENDEKDKFKFLPEDTLYEIYEAIYPPHKFWPRVDGLEFEELVEVLEKDFRIPAMEFLSQHPQCTFGELTDYVIVSCQDDTTKMGHKEKRTRI